MTAFKFSDERPQGEEQDEDENEIVNHIEERERQITAEREGAQKGQKRAAEKMVENAKRNCNRAEVGGGSIFLRWTAGPTKSNRKNFENKKQCIPGWHKEWSFEELHGTPVTTLVFLVRHS